MSGERREERKGKKEIGTLSFSAVWCQGSPGWFSPRYTSFSRKKTILFFLPIKKAFLSIHCGVLVNFGPYFALPFPPFFLLNPPQCHYTERKKRGGGGGEETSVTEIDFRSKAKKGKERTSPHFPHTEKKKEQSLSISPGYKYNTIPSKYV